MRNAYEHVHHYLGFERVDAVLADWGRGLTVIAFRWLVHQINHNSLFMPYLRAEQVIPEN
jgi:hypothetical protein